MWSPCEEFATLMTGIQLLLQGQKPHVSSFFKLNACAAVVKKKQQPKSLTTFY